MSAPAVTGLIDRVDQSDRAVGTVRRGDALRLGANFRTAHAFVFHPDGRLLLQQLGPAQPRHPGRWGSSVAAYLRAGESYRAAVERRAREELGLRTALERVGKIRMHDRRSTKFIELYRAEAAAVRVVDPGHIAEVRFVPLGLLDEETVTRAEAFTPTFLELYAFFKSSDASIA